MVILGLSGAFNVLDDEVVPCLPRGFFHDAAAAILVDGELVAAVEEERLTRIKHTNAFPQQAVSRCLELAHVSRHQIDAVAYFFDESFVNRQCDLLGLRYPAMPLGGIRRLVADRLDGAVDLQHIEFVRHHDAHAAAAFYHSDFDAALIAIMDGSGEAEAISMYHGHGDQIELRRRYPEGASLGEFYFRGTRFLGFGIFDQYKVMGLAPHGNAAPFRDLFRSLYELHDDGGFTFDFQQMDAALLDAGLRPRRRHEPIGAAHADFAAGLQETLEAVAHHLVAAGLLSVGSRRLCLAGGVAHNCTMNGALARSGLADDVFVHPASHDAGAAIGSACYVAARRGVRPVRPRSVFLGSDIGEDDEIARSLDAWRAHVDIERCDDPARVAAGLLARNEVIAWVQGRAEFGPRALGHRSILGDPRPVANRERINHVVKKREGFRPFAPAVLDEAADTFFDIARAIANPETMSFTVPVRPEHHGDLGAITHVDGSARVQVVRRQDDALFWRLIKEFGTITGVPVVLNTSFNNSVEPIVDSVDDAMRCHLTTRLDALFVGPFLVRRKLPIDLRSLAPQVLPGYTVVVSRTRDAWCWEIAESSHVCDGRRIRVSEPTALLLLRADGAQPVAQMIASRDAASAELVLSDLHRAWDARTVDFRPPSGR